MAGPTVSLGNKNVTSATPVQLTKCTRKPSAEYEVCLRPRFYRSHRFFRFLLCRKEGLCLLVFLFFLFWSLFAIVGAVHYHKWYPSFDLKDVHIRSFNVTPARALSYDMDILIEARRFSPLRRIEQYSYEIRTSHVGTAIGASSIPGFHPIQSEIMELTTTQRVSLLPLGDELGDLVRKDLNATGRLVIRFYIEGQIYTPLFLAMKKRGGWTCDVIVSPAAPLGPRSLRECAARIFHVSGKIGLGLPVHYLSSVGLR
ncbi:hypothetical protein KC19_N023400 [Ceratodon purpureus]|nr:hypothetical protein KC19_N023400 [Ceratodon purpureus]